MALPTASDNQFPKVILEEVATDGSATTSPAADHRALFVGEDGALHLKDSAGTVTTPGFSNPMTTAGDSIYGGASGAPTRLAIGTAGQVWTVNAGATAPEWATPSASGGITVKHATSTAAGADQSYSTTFADLFPTQLSTVIAASAGDVLEFMLTLTHNDTDGQSCLADFHIGATTNARIGDTTKGSFIYFHADANGQFYSHTVVGYRVVVANDISAGNVTVKPQVRSDVNANPDIFYNTPPVVFVVKNLGAEA